MPALGAISPPSLHRTPLRHRFAFLSTHYYIVWLYHSITAILISRFLLHLQSGNQKVTGEDFRTTHGGSVDQTESLVFQRVVGSIASSTSESVGAGLGFGEYDAEVEGAEALAADEVEEEG